jgi:Tfp pilus assembly protein PilF
MGTASYKEVAVITSFRRFVRTWVAAVAVGASMLGAVGCTGTSSMLTYATDAREKGLKQYKAHEYENAAGSFRSATRQDPRDYKSFYFLGECYRALGSNQQAAQAFQSSLEVMELTLEGRQDKPFRAQAIQGLGAALAKGHDRTAEIAMPKPGKRPAEDAWLRATVFRHSGDADAAVEAYTAAALQAPGDFYIAKDFGLYLEELGQARQADIHLRRAYQLNSSDEQVANALRRVGTVPGPGLKEKDALARPPVPQGPLPELKMPKFGGGGRQASAPPAPPAAPENSTVQAPRD